MDFNNIFFILNYFTFVIIFALVSRHLAISVSIKRSIVLFLNLTFYFFSGYKGLLFLLVYSLITYFCTIICRTFHKKVTFAVCILVLCIPLIFIKTMVFSLFVPLGISVFSFEAISLISDIYREKMDKVSMPDTVLYLTFFVTVQSGPIIRYDRFISGFLSEHIRSDGIYSGIRRFVIGLSKKLLIADRIAPLADYYFDGVSKGLELSNIGLWMGSIAYSMQIFFHFSGYSDMAIGLGQIMGFDIPENFNRPYSAGSISDFWKRWHITLTDWFREYIYTAWW